MSVAFLIRKARACGLRPLVALAALLLAQPLVAAPLPEVVRDVLQQHPDMRTSQALLNAAEERINQSRSNYYPIIGVEAVAADASDLQFGQPVERTTRRSDAFLRWNLFRGLADLQTVRMAQHDRDAAAADLAETHEQVALQVTQAYLDVLRLRRQLILGEEYLAEHRRLHEDIRTRADLGRIAAVDVEYARESLIQAELLQSQLRGQLRGAEQLYHLLAGVEPTGLVEPVLDSAPANLSLEQLMEQVLGGSRRVQAAQEQAQARAAEVRIAAGSLYPSLDLELRRSLQYDIEPVPVTETDHSTQLQLRYQLPLGGGNYSRKREAVERKLAAQAVVDTQLLQVRSEVARLWSSWQEVRAIAPRLEERLEASGRVVQAYDLQFAAARRTLTDLIDSRNDHYRAQVDQLNNRMEQYITSAQVLSLLGQLRASLLAAGS